MISEKNIIHRLTYLTFSVGMIWVLVMMVLTSIDVTTRYFFSSPVRGSFELSELMLAVFGMLGMAYTEKMGANVKVRILENFLPSRVVLFLNSLTYLLSLGIVLIIVYQSFVMGIEEYHYKTSSDSLGVPVYPFYFLLSFGSFVLSAQLALSMVNSLHMFISNRTSE
ncbi:MAG: hypothetical protein VR64_20430 [Desulfatitalea sp. BRH_c12]|nr:MAG: hypothetical protein VR64_20430 [Desulfatitalea sp. BRH_c12]